MGPRLVLPIVGALLAACSATAAPPAATAATIGAVKVTTTANAQRTLGEAVAGHPALVSLWATWCDACTKEIDALNRLDESAKKRGGLVVGVDEGETLEQVADFTRARGVRYEVLLDAEFQLGDVVGHRRLPTTIVLDRKGSVVYSGGVLDEAALEAFRSALAAP